MKRAFDIAVALLVLILVTPVLAATAVGIRLASPGPVLYRARRVGKGGRPFEMLKFRSMHVAHGGAVITAHKDTRIFAVGRLIRKFKIDELPQLVNVIRGEMSIVGPRPEDPKIVAEAYTDWMMETLEVAPGVTSPGAVFYYSLGEQLIDPADPEGSYVKRLLTPKLAVERAYLERANLASDLATIARTALAILCQPFGWPVLPAAVDRRAAERWCSAGAFPEGWS